MGQITRIEISFFYDEGMKPGLEIARDLIKFYYMDGISTLMSVYDVYEAFVRERERIRAYPTKKILEEHPYCALRYLSGCYSTVYIPRCADLQRYLPTVGSEDYSGFFYHLCFALMREMPDMGFDAFSRFIMTVTDHVEIIRAYYDTRTLGFEQISGYMPFEDDSQNDDYPMDTAEWILLPRCIAVNGEKVKHG